MRRKTPNPENHAWKMINDGLIAALGTTPEPPEPLDPSCPLLANPAVARCYEAYIKATKAAIDREVGPMSVSREANKAYCLAMPTLSGSENIRNFVACVTHAMVLDIITSTEGTKLLYAAQVAYSTRETRSHHAKSKPPQNPS